jgi:hypothetical protein
MDSTDVVDIVEHVHYAIQFTRRLGPVIPES